MTAIPNQHWGGENRTSVSRFVTSIVAVWLLKFVFWPHVCGGSQRIHMYTFELLYSQLLLVFSSYCRTGRFVPGG